MPWQVVLPIAASILQSGIAGGLAANQATKQQNRQSALANIRRQELQPIIDRLREAQDYFSHEEQLSRDFTRASDQMAAQAAQSGTTNAGSGGLDQVRGDLLGSMLASLADVKVQDQRNRERLLAELLSDPSLYEGELPSADVGGATVMGALGGGLAGASTAFQGFLSTPEGVAALEKAFGGPAPVALSTPTPKQTTGNAVTLPIPKPKAYAPPVYDPYAPTGI